MVEKAFFLIPYLYVNWKHRQSGMHTPTIWSPIKNIDLYQKGAGFEGESWHYTFIACVYVTYTSDESHWYLEVLVENQWENYVLGSEKNNSALKEKCEDSVFVKYWYNWYISFHVCIFQIIHCVSPTGKAFLVIYCQSWLTFL